MQCALNTHIHKRTITVGTRCTSSVQPPLTITTITIIHDSCKTKVGYVIAGMRSTRQAQVGDTLFHHQSKDSVTMPEPLPGFEKARSMLFARCVCVGVGRRTGGCLNL